MKRALIAALSLFFTMFLTASQIHAGQWQSMIQEGIHAYGRKEDRKSVLIQLASSPKLVKDARMMLKSGATADRATPEPPLLIVPWAGKGSAVQLFLKYVPDPNLATRSCQSAPMADTDKGTIGLFRLLVERHAGLDARNGEGFRTLIKPAEQENLEIGQALVASGVDVSPCDLNGETALMTDAATGYQDAVGASPVTGAENSVPTPYG